MNFILVLSAFFLSVLAPQGAYEQVGIDYIHPVNKDQEPEIRKGTFNLSNNKTLQYKIDREYAGWNHYACKVEIAILQSGKIVWKEIIFDEMVDDWPELNLKNDKLTVKLKYYEHQSENFTISTQLWVVKNNRLEKFTGTRSK